MRKPGAQDLTRSGMEGYQRQLLVCLLLASDNLHDQTVTRQRRKRAHVYPMVACRWALPRQLSEETRRVSHKRDRHWLTGATVSRQVVTAALRHELE